MSTLDLFQDYAPPAPTPTAPYVPNSPTSKAAAERVRPTILSKEERVLAAVKAAGRRGLTCQEAEKITGFEHTTCSARMRGLEDKGLVAKTKDTRPTRSGCRATVYVAAEHAR